MDQTVTSTDVVEFLLFHGYREYKDQFKAEARCFQLVTYEAKPWDEKDQRRHFIDVHLYDEQINNHLLQSVTIGKRVESKKLEGSWLTAEFYSLDYKEFIEKYPKLILAMEEIEKVVEGLGQ